MEMPIVGKKSYKSIMSTFTGAVRDLEMVSKREAVKVVNMNKQRQKIEDNISVVEAEIGCCSEAIDNINKMFPSMSKMVNAKK